MKSTPIMPVSVKLKSEGGGRSENESEKYKQREREGEREERERGPTLQMDGESCHASFHVEFARIRRSDCTQETE